MARLVVALLMVVVLADGCWCSFCSFPEVASGPQSRCDGALPLISTVRCCSSLCSSLSFLSEKVPPLSPLRMLAGVMGDTELPVLEEVCTVVIDVLLKNSRSFWRSVLVHSSSVSSQSSEPYTAACTQIGAGIFMQFMGRRRVELTSDRWAVLVP